MKLKHAGLAAVAMAAVLSAPVFAQSSTSGVSSGTGAAVSSGTGAAVNPSSSTMPGASATTSATTGASTTTTTTNPATGASASVTTTPSTAMAVETAPRLLPGGVMSPMSSTTVLGGPAETTSGSKTVVTQYWVNVPAHVERRGDFQRWTHLK